ncbi:LysR family transcriptional regulator [Vitiosangium sp. GDMCC 1.1324]|uniref:LysR family transcriptional regulator n=1 Tax=Vitiosangium sp. (strain GDMCC 1.1324) TaxID=2138576 RepID=UPI000D3CC4E2|nr:LysR family transcriptional regulator [Vitiosangium sp. GDMCC 1.1324]PTL76289.1 LysR family transcriptional regulator [Vitiosangium sp. GDMCC 1.1324]
MQNAVPTWDDLRVLLALHRHRSFLAAGRSLGVSTSTAARRIEALEAALGRTLVHRSSAGTSVEPDALELVALAEQLEHGLEAARRDEGDTELSGTVRISLGEGFVRPATQVLSELRRKHQEIHIELVSESRTSDLARREADIGIRKVRSSSPVLIERAVGRLRFALYASQSYIERRLRGGQLRAGDFERHDFVGYDGTMRKLPQEQWLLAQGAKRFPFRSNSDFALQEAAERGQGICLMAEAHGRTVDGLVRLDVDVALPSVPVFLVFHRELRNVPRVRVVVNTLEAALRHGLS